MSLSVGQAVERAFLRIGKGLSEEEAKIYRHAIEAAIPDALNKLVEMANKTPDYPLQQKTFTGITLSGGIGSLPTNMAVHTIEPQGRVTDSSGTLTRELQFLPSPGDLELPRNDEYVYYAIRGNAVGGSIFVRAGLRATFTPTSVDILAGVLPTLANGYSITTTITDLAVQHEDDIIDILVDLLTDTPPNVSSTNK